MIRLEIIADRKSRAEDLARLLAFDDHIEIVAAHAMADRTPVSGHAEVVLAINLLSSQIPRRTVPVVALSEDHIERVHASLPLDSAAVEKLTGRELEVLALLSDGLSNNEIAGALHISKHTAKFHVAQVLAKLGASTRTEAVRIGLRRGLIAL